MIKVLLYYKYTDIKQPEKLRLEQYNLCSKLNIKGRILISNEGINGTCAGEVEEIEQYILETEKELGRIEWKISYSENQVFPKIRVVVRDEIVTLGLKRREEDVDINAKANYIEPEELKELLEKDEELYIIDARNDYETEIGKFKKTIDLPIKNFRDFPEAVKKIDNLKDKKVVTICTGGVRCEKASAYLRENGFTNVRQLHGGIVTYAEKTGGKDFLGTCYVFDQRIHVEVNKVNPEIISQCIHCKTSVARYINCCNAKCNKQIICCEACEVKFEQACSEECQSKSRYKVKN
jgi:UPF0176 protein